MLQQQLGSTITGTIETTTSLRSFQIPYVVLPVEHDGLTHALSVVSASTLSDLCDQFRKDIFAKAGKLDPNLQCKVQR